MTDRPEDLWIDAEGVLAERTYFGGRELIVHYDDIPAKDITMVDGIPVTTALRTVIDLAPEVDLGHLRAIVQDALDRRLFTAAEAMVRISEPDMRSRIGALLLRQVLTRPFP